VPAALLAQVLKLPSDASLLIIDRAPSFADRALGHVKSNGAGDTEGFFGTLRAHKTHCPGG